MPTAVWECSRILNEHLLSLKFVFGSSVVHILDPVDQQSITLISLPNERSLKVLVKHLLVGLLIITAHVLNLSSCLLSKSDSILCKHLLAVYLNQVMEICQQPSVSDKQMTSILMVKK